MESLNCSKTAAFYHHVHKLKHIKRSGWLRYPIREPETVASHSYSVALLSWLLSEGKADTERMLKMALVHDLAEAICGDMTPHDKEYKRKRQIEEDCLRKIASALPGSMRREIMGLQRELEEGKTIEAKTVGMADKLDMVLTAAEYGKPGARLGEFFDVSTPGFTESGMKLLKYLKSLRDSE